MVVSKQTLEALASIIRNPKSIEQLPVSIRQLLVENPVGTLAGLIQVLKLETQSTKSEILEWIGTVKICATTERFVAKEKFVGFSNNFTAWFLNGDGKTEDPISEQTLRYHKLQESSVDGPIIEELGGEAKAETTLSEMFSLMEKQGKGEDGVLLNNGYANIFYIKDAAGVLRAVYVRWNDDGWDVYAFSVEDPLRWLGGRQVFSRNSVLESSEPSAPAQA